MRREEDEVGKKNQALGRGLDSIFGSDVEAVLDDIQNNSSNESGMHTIEIPVDEIRPNPYQPRKEFDKKALNELADSIKVHGIFTPLLVRKALSGYDLLAGERRLRAAKMAGLDKVPAIEMDFTEEEMMELSLLENIQREDLNPIEEAIAYESLVSRLGYTQERLAKRVGKSREYCANMLRLLNLPSEVQDMVSNKELTMGHVRPLLSLKDEGMMYDAACYIKDHNMSVREVEQYVKELKGEGKKPKVKPVKNAEILDLERQLSSRLDTKVAVNGKKLTIKFRNTDDLNRILEILGCLEESL